jgi:hypothetical protein
MSRKRRDRAAQPELSFEQYVESMKDEQEKLTARCMQVVSGGVGSWRER